MDKRDERAQEDAEMMHFARHVLQDPLTHPKDRAAARYLLCVLEKDRRQRHPPDGEQSA